MLIETWGAAPGILNAPAWQPAVTRAPTVYPAFSTFVVQSPASSGRAASGRWACGGVLCVVADATAGLASAAGAGASAGIPQAVTMTSPTAAQIRRTVIL